MTNMYLLFKLQCIHKILAIFTTIIDPFVTAIGMAL